MLEGTEVHEGEASILLGVLCGERLSVPAWYGVVSARMERMAFADSPEPEPKTRNHTMLLQCINAIVRTAGMKPAALSQPRTDQFLVPPDQQNHCFGWKTSHA
jgi:hypothetical protein